MTLLFAASPETVPPMAAVTGLVVQLTVTALALAATLLPLPPVTPQVCVGLLGCVVTVTAKEPPLLMVVRKTKTPFLLIGSVSLPLSSSTNPLPASPETVPPIVKGPAEPVPVVVPAPDNLLERLTTTKIATIPSKKKDFCAALMTLIVSCIFGGFWHLGI